MEEELLDPSSLSIRELKQLLADRGVDFSDCIEKADLIAKVVNTAGASPDTHHYEKIRGVRVKRKKVHGLSCVVVDNTDKPKWLAVVLHGYGANNADLAPIASMVIEQMRAPKEIRFVLPDAIHTIAANSYGWWSIDMMKLMMMAMSGQMQQLFEETPEGMEEAHATVLSFIEALKADLGIDWDHVILVGFSQGSMLATDIALHLPTPPAFLAALSGAPVREQEWKARMKDRAGLKVLQAHGTGDPILPYFVGQHLRDLLQGGGLDVEFHEFDGGHTVPAAIIQRLAQCISALGSESSNTR